MAIRFAELYPPVPGGERTVPGFLLVVAAIVLLPLPVLAFGPIVHLDLGLDLLGSAGLMAAGVSRLLRRHPESFLRGTLDPDRSLAKNLASYCNHSHNWTHAFRQVRQARDEVERAAFLGYLCHLAADTVAHNGFVPSRIVEAWRNPVAGHLYWEMRADARVRRRSGASLMWLVRPEDPAHREFLRRTVRPSLPGRRLQVRLTGLALKIQRGNAYGSATDLLDRRSSLLLDGDEINRAWTLALAAQKQVLEELDDAGISAIDPRGIAALKHAREVRRELRSMSIRGASPQQVSGRIDAARMHFLGLVSTGLDLACAESAGAAGHCPSDGMPPEAARSDLECSDAGLTAVSRAAIMSR
jgi:hypothetical protein